MIGVVAVRIARTACTAMLALALAGALPGTGAAAAAQAGSVVAGHPDVDADTHRAQVRTALQLAERGPTAKARTALRALGDHPLAAWLEYALLQRQLDTATPGAVRAFLERHATSPAAPLLRDAWLSRLAQRGEWGHYRAFRLERPLEQLDAEQRCAVLRATLDAGLTPALLEAIEATWLQGESQPALCDPAFEALEAAGRITDTLRWRRVVLAAHAGASGLMRHLAAQLPARQRTRVLAFAGFVDAPDASAAHWPREPVAAAIAASALVRHARRDPVDAERLLELLADRLAFDPAERRQVLAAVALWSAASYLPGSAERLARVPAEGWDARLHEWRVREALARGDRTQVLAALQAMPAAQRQEPRWRYLQARMHERGGDPEAARALLQPLAREAHFHGFLAADRLRQPYALCPLEPAAVGAARDRAAAHPGLARALELHALDRRGWAGREWRAALAGMDDGTRVAAVERAVQAGWYDRAVFGLQGEQELRLYALRFPLDHAAHLRSSAGHQGLDPAWVAALIRAESSWMADARSPANARGLMQLLPATGKAIAQRLGMRWRGAAMLHEPLANITLGTAYLRAMLDRFDATPAIATAAYNAGPTPATRWSSERAAQADALDLWIETIPYHETRAYVARVFAFSVIYDWRLNGDALPLTQRLAGTDGAGGTRRGFHCPDATQPSLASRP